MIRVSSKLFFFTLLSICLVVKWSPCEHSPKQIHIENKWITCVNNYRWWSKRSFIKSTIYNEIVNILTDRDMFVFFSVSRREASILISIESFLLLFYSQCGISPDLLCFCVLDFGIYVSLRFYIEWFILFHLRSKISAYIDKVHSLDGRWLWKTLPSKSINNNSPPQSTNPPFYTIQV